MNKLKTGEFIEENEPLPEHTAFDYYECYAKIVLEEMFPEQFYDLTICDKPDLQNIQLDLGIEVTSSIKQKQKEAEALYTKWTYQNDKQREKTAKKIEECGAKLFEGVLAGVPGQDNFDNIYRSIKKKLERLSFGLYKLYGQQYLFIFSDIYATSSMRVKALDEMCRICPSASNTFDGIYILVPGSIYIFDLAKNHHKRN